MLVLKDIFSSFAQVQPAVMVTCFLTKNLVV